jgi:crooked neck
LGDIDRARGIYELAVQQALDMPELVWKVSCRRSCGIRSFERELNRSLSRQAFIDFEARQSERERTRVLYERLLERTAHVKVSLFVNLSLDGILMFTCANQVFISYALMEASKIGETDEDEDEAEADAAQVEAEIEGDTGDPEKARAVFERGYKALKERGEKEDVSRACGRITWSRSADTLGSC